MSKPACMAPTASASSMTRAAWNCRSTSAAASPGRPTTASRTEPHVVEGDGAEAPREIHRLHRRHRDTARRRWDEDLGQRRRRRPSPSASRALDEEVRRLPGGLDRTHRAAQHEVLPVTAELDAGAPRVRPRAELGDVPRGDLGPGQQARQHVGMRPVRAQRRGDDVGRHQRPRRRVLAELVCDQAEVDQARPADRAAPVLLGHQQRCPPELRALAPVAGVEARRIVAQRARSASGGACCVKKRAVVSRKNS